MNKFTQHIPNYVDTCSKLRFEFTDLKDLCDKLSLDKTELVYNNNAIMRISKDEKEWYVLGYTKEKVEGIPKWRGVTHNVIEIDSVHGYGKEDFQYKKIGQPFQIRGDEIEWYSHCKNTIIGELKDGRCFIGLLEFEKTT